MKRTALLSLSLLLVLPLLSLGSMTTVGAAPAPAVKRPANAKDLGPLSAPTAKGLNRNTSTFGTSSIRDKWALVIGISKFAHPEYNLKYAAKDAEDFKNFLISDCNFAPDHIKFLENEGATRGAIMDAFGDNWLPRVVIPGDLVVIYISTHGTPSTRDAGGRNYIVAYDTDWEKLYSEGVEMNSLSAQIKERVKSDRVLIVMDTCYSGAAAANARGREAPANFDANEIAQGTGRLVLSSSSPNERSWEGAGYQNGIFTFNLIKALKQKNVDVLTAFAEVKKNVQWEAQSNFGASQTPSLGGKWEGINLILSVPPAEPRGIPNALKDVPKTFSHRNLGPLRADDLATMCIDSISSPKGEPGLFPAGTEMVLPEGANRVMLLGGCGTTSEIDLKLQHPTASFSLTRVGVLNGSSIPKWRMDAFDASGQLVGTTGEAQFGFDNQFRKFTVTGKAPIVQIKLFYDNRNADGVSPWGTYNSLPIVKFEHAH